MKKYSLLLIIMLSFTLINAFGFVDAVPNSEVRGVEVSFADIFSPEETICECSNYSIVAITSASDGFYNCVNYSATTNFYNDEWFINSLNIIDDGFLYNSCTISRGDGKDKWQSFALG